MKTEDLTVLFAFPWIQITPLPYPGFSVEIITVNNFFVILGNAYEYLSLHREYIKLKYMKKYNRQRIYIILCKW